jgi:RimJ/RimL family protein N-acetyltransferase
MENDRKYHQGLWAMILKVEGICIGDCGITVQMIERDLVPEIGVHVLKRYWNEGVTTEAAKACMDHAWYPAIYS